MRSTSNTNGSRRSHMWVPSKRYNGERKTCNCQSLYTYSSQRFPLLSISILVLVFLLLIFSLWHNTICFFLCTPPANTYHHPFSFARKTTSSSDLCCVSHGFLEWSRFYLFSFSDQVRTTFGIVFSSCVIIWGVV